jgi:tripartite-type tricarboxylate transporter receptor subunit TctC
VPLNKNRSEEIEVKASKLNALALVLSAVVAAGVHAQTYPIKPVRIVVPFAPGGATDTFSRALANELTPMLGQQVLVDSRPGAGTTIGAEIVAKSPPDGYTLLFTDLSTHSITPSLYKKLGYEPLKSFAPVAIANVSPLVLVVHPSVGVKTAKELIAVAKRNPGMACGNSGVGTVTHMTAEKFAMLAGIRTTAVSYKGGAVPVIALLGGEIPMVVTTVPASIEHVKKGKLVALGLFADKRSAVAPDIPALGETLKGAEGAVISGVLAPVGTPGTVIDRLNAAFARANAAPKVKEIYASNAAEAVHVTPAAVQQQLERDAKMWARIVAATGVTPN